MNRPTRDSELPQKIGHNHQGYSELDNDLPGNKLSSNRGKSLSRNSSDWDVSEVPGSDNEEDDHAMSCSSGHRDNIALKTTPSSSSKSNSKDHSRPGSTDVLRSSDLEGYDDTTMFLESNRSTYRARKASGETFNEKLGVLISNWRQIIKKYGQFIGPGIMVSVAYMDPGNYSTAVSAGALYQYKLLFVILLSNLFAAFLQILCVKLGSVTGLDLAQNCRKHLPHWLCISVYILAEIAIIATDLAEVVGTAIALNILFGIPLAVGVALTVIDVLLVLMAYRPNGPMRIVRYFEYLVTILVLLVVICFAVELSKIGATDVSSIFKGFLPSKELVESQGLYLSCAILGATVMPHSLYLGSGLVQPRLREYDIKHGYYLPQSDSTDNLTSDYKPTIYAIKYAMNYSIAELVLSLCTVAVFVNSAILIVAGSTLSGSPDEAVDADLFSIYDMLKNILGPAAGTVFALALLFSGQSAGIVCTLSGQMVSEGFLSWTFKPYIRRLVTRGIAIAPCFVVAIFVGRKGLANVLNASQVVLSLLLPFVSAPLLYFTCSKTIMKVPIISERLTDDMTINNEPGYSPIIRTPSYSTIDNMDTSSMPPKFKDMSNGLLTNIIAVAIFVFVTGLNLFLIISMLMGVDVHL